MRKKRRTKVASVRGSSCYVFVWCRSEKRAVKNACKSERRFRVCVQATESAGMRTGESAGGPWFRPGWCTGITERFAEQAQQRRVARWCETTLAVVIAAI
uniref:Secreted protein n=1 Tax=Ascaris lumbricoides TaxID=6252 RepID=A0A0M3HU85_ASCLU